MSLIKFNDPFRFPWTKSVLSNWLDAEDILNDDFFVKDSLMPAMNVKEHNEDLEIELAAPGFSKKDFNITIDNSGLHISAERTNERKEEDEGYLRKEFSYNSFRRSMRLPESIDIDKKVKANYEDGILRFKLLKKEEAKTLPKKVIEVS
ncbi:MAG: Hsp20/alpha crystallin family protein [Flavobacteriaceae bacterium]|nr:Hsp20/alpha crystallin family protein [Flavobacteriaceae bacterium]